MVFRGGHLSCSLFSVVSVNRVRWLDAFSLCGISIVRQFLAMRRNIGQESEMARMQCRHMASVLFFNFWQGDVLFL